MYWDEQDSGASGSIPEFGAIFMSNTETKKESFKRKIFALPSSKAEFVKHIKAGMVLFLFEFKKRQLFGVYQASSNGAMDIVPHAFNYSGKHFPAQVCFTLIWNCDPIPEKEFRHAIRENYFSAKKFNFGLSEDQVHRLLYLFSSRKLKNKMSPCPLSETVVEAAGKQRRLMVDDRFELSERGYMKAAEYDVLNPALFDHHANSLTGAKEEEVLVDNRPDIEGKLPPYSEEDFLAKRRRLGNDDRLITDDVAENAIYNCGTLRTFSVDSPKDSLDKLRRLADDGRILPFERINENQADRIVNRSEYLMDPLDVIASDDYRFMQSRLVDEYNLENGSGQAFASDSYGESLDKIQPAIDNDKFFLDGSMQRGYYPHDSFEPVDYGDSNLNLFRQARESIDDQESLMNRKFEIRSRLDSDCNPIRGFEQSASPPHKIRKTTAAGRLPINESEPHFGTSSVEGFSFEKVSGPSQYGHWIIYDPSYPVVEKRLNEDTVGNDFCSPGLAKSAGYIMGVDRLVVDDGRIRKSERADTEGDSHMRTNPLISMEHPSFCQLKQNLSSFSDKLPEDGLPRSTVSHNFDPSHSTFNDATITRAVPYSPEHPSFSHGHSASIPANQNSSLVWKNHPDQGSLGGFYFLSKNRLLYYPESEKSSRPQDIAPGFGNGGFSTSTSENQSSMLREPTSSFANSNLHVHMDLNTSAPLNYRGSLFPKHAPRNAELVNIEGGRRLFLYPSESREKPVHMDLKSSTPINNRGSLFSKLSPQCSDLENIEGERGSFAYPSKSRDNHFVFDRNLPTASVDMNKHVPRHEMYVLGDQEYSCSGSKDFCLGISHPERDLASHENLYLRSTNMKFHEVSEAPRTNSVNRRSVFSRLMTSKEESKFGKERNDTDFNLDGGSMDATAYEVMEMLKQLRKSGVGQAKDGENAVNEKKRENAVNENKTQSHIETNLSTMETNERNEASTDTADGTDEVPKETRVVDFKRRSERKILVGVTAGSDTRNTVIGRNEEVKSSMKTTLKRKKLVRPAFSKTGSVTDAMCNTETLQNPLPVLDKDDKQSSETAISVYEAEVSNENTTLSNVLPSHARQPADCNSNWHQDPEEQKDLVAPVLPSTIVELKEHESTNVYLHIGSAQVLKEPTQQKSSGSQSSAEGILAKDVDTTVTDLNMPKSSLEGFGPGAGCGSNLVKEKHKKNKKRKKKITRTCKTDGVFSVKRKSL